MTGTLTVLTSRPLASATNVLERTMSNVVTPNILRVVEKNNITNFMVRRFIIEKN